MNRKFNPQAQVEDAKETRPRRASPAPAATPDLLDAGAAAMQVAARLSAWMQEVQFAQLEAVKACSTAIAQAAVEARRTPASNGTMPVLGASAEAVVAAVRQSQDAWIRSAASLQEDMLELARARADAARSTWQAAWMPQPSISSSQAFDPIDALNQARQSVDAWIGQWSSVLAPRPVSVA
jgi:hypothetical protein